MIPYLIFDMSCFYIIWVNSDIYLIIIQIKDDNLVTSAILQENIRKNWEKVQCVRSRQEKRNRQWERKESLMILFNGLFWYLGLEKSQHSMCNRRNMCIHFLTMINIYLLSRHSLSRQLYHCTLLRIQICFNYV